MKARILALFIAICFFSTIGYSQSPQKLNYQAVLRDVSGNPIQNSNVAVKLSVLQGSSTGTAVCIEEFSPTTNEYGIITLEVGSSNTVDFEAIDWSAGPYYLKVELDETGGTNYTEMSVSQLLSVPYALHSLSAERLTGSFEGQLIIDNNGPLANSEQVNFLSNGNHMSRIQSYTSNELDAMLVFSNAKSGTLAENMRINADGDVGIGTTTPKAKLDVHGSFSLYGNYPSDAWSTSLLGLGPVGGYFGTQGSYQSYWSWNGYRQSGTNNWVVGGAHTYTSSGFISIGDNGIELRTEDYGAVGEYTWWPASRMIITNEGNVGIGTQTPSSRLEVKVSSSWSDEEPLFEVKNNDGISVFAVYNNGVQITIEDDPQSKASKGGFAIGGFDPTKAGETVDFMRITPDSIRFNIANDNSKGAKGGFAIGGFDRTKKGSVNEDFMYITPGGSNAGAYNTKLGYQSGYSLTGGLHNVMFGYKAGYKTEGSFYLSKGSRNIFMGNYAGYDNIEGKDNIAIGFEAGRKITGNENIYIGTTAGKELTGSGNIIIGKYVDGVFGSSESDNFVLSNGSGALPLIAGNFSDRVVAIDANLYLYRTYGNTVSGAADLYIQSNGLLGTISSSARYKENISAMDDMSWFNKILPVEFTYIEDASKSRQYGLIAEEVEKIDPYFVSYNQDGQVETVTYSKFITPLIKVVQNQQDEIDELRDQIAQLKQMMQE